MRNGAHHHLGPSYGSSSIPTATSLLDTSGEGDDEDEEAVNPNNNNNSDSDGSSEEWDSLQQTDNRQLARDCLQVEDRNHLLRQKLRDIQRQRRRLRNELNQCDALHEELHWQHVAVSCQRQQALEELLACRQRHGNLQQQLGRTQQWNVLTNDAFHIDVNTDGCATINSLRLGAVSVCAVASNPNPGSHEPSVSAVSSSAQYSSSLSSTTAAAASSSSTVGAFFSLVSGGGILSTAQQQPPQQQPSAPFSATKVIRVPWREINAALGQVALLLFVLEQNLAVPSSDGTTTNSRKPLFRYEIQAMGSTSKIGIRPTASTASSSSTTATSFYNLYFAEEGFQLFGRRNFNTALHYLVDCVQSAAEIVQQRHGSIVLPHAVVQPMGTGTSTTTTATTIGGMTIQYFAMNSSSTNPKSAVTEAEHWLEWTRAMKYLLTNIKHLMTYPGIGLWSSN